MVVFKFSYYSTSILLYYLKLNIVIIPIVGIGLGDHESIVVCGDAADCGDCQVHGKQGHDILTENACKNLTDQYYPTVTWKGSVAANSSIPKGCLFDFTSLSRYFNSAKEGTKQEDINCICTFTDLII